MVPTVTLQSRERALRSLRQTGSVSELAIAFQTIVHTFFPLWADHPLIYTFSEKLKENIRFKLTAQEEMTFVGFLVSKSGIGMDPAKVAAILEWPTPTTVKEV